MLPGPGASSRSGCCSPSFRRWAAEPQPSPRRLEALLPPFTLLCDAVQACGTDLILYYTTTLIHQTSLYSSDPQLADFLSTGGVGIIALASGIAGLHLYDLLGRRTCLLAGTLTLTVCHAMLAVAVHQGISSLILASVFTAIAASNMSLLPLAAVICSEIFPMRIVGRCARPHPASPSSLEIQVDATPHSSLAERCRSPSWSPAPRRAS